ncbi:hypothetical protein PENSPDRAFT_671509 [Peniophora sp. CONT]|nr:hypothetical protein PENSPDRAFT_671509 [Peniophora sp. CONT]
MASTLPRSSGSQGAHYQGHSSTGITFNRLKIHLSHLPYICLYTGGERNNGFTEVELYVVTIYAQAMSLTTRSSALPGSPQDPIDPMTFEVSALECTVPCLICFCGEEARLHTPQSPKWQARLPIFQYVDPFFSTACSDIFFVNVREILQWAAKQGVRIKTKVYPLLSGQDYSMSSSRAHAPTPKRDIDRNVSVSDGHTLEEQFFLTPTTNDTSFVEALVKGNVNNGYSSNVSDSVGHIPMCGHDEFLGDFSHFECPLTGNLAGKLRSEVPLLSSDKILYLLLKLNTSDFKQLALLLDNCNACGNIMMSESSPIKASNHSNVPLVPVSSHASPVHKAYTFVQHVVPVKRERSVDSDIVDRLTLPSNERYVYFCQIKLDRAVPVLPISASKRLSSSKAFIGAHKPKQPVPSGAIVLNIFDFE